MDHFIGSELNIQVQGYTNTLVMGHSKQSGVS